MEFMKANELDFDPRAQMADILVEGFYEHFRHFSKDKGKLARAFATAFDLSVFYVAVEDGKIASFIGVTEKKSPALNLDKKVFRKELGFIMGSLAYKMLNKMMVAKPYPFPIEKGTGVIDFVATSPDFRGRGATFELMNHAMKSAGYKRYILEVVDNNVPAIGLYKKLGFKEFTTAPEKHPKQAGFDYYSYMEKPM